MGLKELGERPFDLRRLARKQERVAVKDQALAARAEDLSKNRLALDDVGGVFVKTVLIDVQVRVRVIAQLGAGVEPLVEDAPQSLGSARDIVARIDEADYGNVLLAERGEQPRG